MLGHYIQSDPIGLQGGINTYGYVGGNGLNYIDKLGNVSNGIINGKQLTITLDITLVGHIDNLLVKQLNSYTNHFWNKGNWKYKKCLVTFNFNFTQELGKPNHVYVHPKGLEGISHVNNDGTAIFFNFDSDNLLLMSHEVIHMMGLSDFYDEKTLTPLPGFEKSILAGQRGSEVDQIAVNLSVLSNFNQGKNIPCNCN